MEPAAKTETKQEPAKEKAAEPKPKPKPGPIAEQKVKPQPEQKAEQEAKTEPKRQAEPKPKEPPEEPLQLSFGGLPVVLNGAPLRLEPKEQGGDYYLMDLLERSGMDFSKLDRPVDLLVNGAEGQFSQVLRPNDQVTIRYKDRQTT